MFRRSLLVAILCCVAGLSSANEVSLSTQDGGLEVSGDLISFDGELYIVETEYGRLSIDGTGVICDGPGCPNLSEFVAELRFAGVPNLSGHLLPNLAKDFAQTKGLDVALNSDLITMFDPNTGAIIARLHREPMPVPEAFARQLAGEIDVVMADHAALRSDVIFAESAGLGQLDSPEQAKLIAFDAVVPVVSVRNPVEEIRVSDLADAYSGDLSYWAEIGGVEAPIFAHATRDASAATAIFLERLLIGDDRNIASTVTRHSSALQLSNTIAVDPFALAVTMLSQVNDGKILPLVDRCGLRMTVNGAELASGDYPLVAPIYFYRTSARQPKIIREFFEFIESEGAFNSIYNSGYVPNRIVEMGLNQQPYRVLNALSAAATVQELNALKELTELLNGFSRLSLSLRFVNGSGRFEAQAISGIGSLARALETGELEPKHIIFAGFLEHGEEPGRDLKMAEAVRDAVLAQAITFDPRKARIETRGFGTASPLACDEQSWGKRLNSRVEVWIK